MAGTERQEDLREAWLAAPMASEKAQAEVEHSWNAIRTDGPGHTIAPEGTANGSPAGPFPVPEQGDFSIHRGGRGAGD